MPKFSFATKVQRLGFRVLLTSRLTRLLIRRFRPVVPMEVGGHRMLLHPADNATEYFMWRRGTRRESASIGRLTLLVSQQRALIFDIGANCGAFTLPLAEACGPGSRIMAFEPNPTMAERIRQNLALNGMSDQVEIHEIALGLKNHDAPLWIGSRNLGTSSLRAGVNSSKKSIRVPVRPLVSFYPPIRSDYDVFVIKCDIEGAEDQVLAPFLDSIADENLPDAILIETTSSHLWNRDLKKLLDERGFISLFEGEEKNTLYLRKSM